MVKTRYLSIVIFWLISHGLLFFYSYWDSSHNAELQKLQQSLSHSFYTAKAAAFVINIDSSLVLLAVSRNFLAALGWISGKLFPRSVRVRVLLGESIFVHKGLGFSIVLMGVVHTIAHYINFLRLQEAAIEEAFQGNLKRVLATNCSAETCFAWNPSDLLSNATREFQGMTQSLNFLTIAGSSGNVLWIACFVLGTASLSLRRLNFRFFYAISHCPMAGVYFVGLLVHGCGCFLKTDGGKCINPTSYKFVSLSMVIYLLECFIRCWRGRRNAVQILSIVEHPSRVIEIRFRMIKSCCCWANPYPGQYVFLKCPQIDGIWHPFTLTSAPGDGYMSVHVRMVGPWTQSLYNLVSTGTSKGLDLKALENPYELVRVNRVDDNDDSDTTVPSSESSSGAATVEMIDLKIFCDGPYGSCCSEGILSGLYATCILVGAGIGVTPFASLLRHIVLYHRKSEGNLIPLQQVYFHWICSDVNCFEWFQALLHELETISRLDELETGRAPIRLSIGIYLTERSFCRNSKYVTNVMLSGDCNRDVVTGLSTGTMYGRPNFDQIFRDIALSHQDERIGVFCCGPEGLIDGIQASLDKFHSIIAVQENVKVKYELYQEHF